MVVLWKAQIGFVGKIISILLTENKEAKLIKIFTNNLPICRQKNTHTQPLMVLVVLNV